jgi:hypothetical protein
MPVTPEERRLRRDLHRTLNAIDHNNLFRVAYAFALTRDMPTGMTEESLRLYVTEKILGKPKGTEGEGKNET